MTPQPSPPTAEEARLLLESMAMIARRVADKYRSDNGRADDALEAAADALRLAYDEIYGG